jgi:hypothetical protein
LIIPVVTSGDKGLRGGAKAATIRIMTEQDLTPEPETNDVSDSGDDLMADDDTLIITDPEAEIDTVTSIDHEELDAAMEANAAEAAPSPLDEEWLPGDIDAALAAVASLSEMMPEREAEAQARADATQGAPTFVPEMPMPPLGTLKRGQPGSIVPALLLIGIGGWLTLTTTSGASPDPLVIAGVIGGGIMLTLLAQWIGTGRWSRGTLFFGLLVLLAAGVIAFSLQPNGIDMVRGYPLLMVALGVALVLAGFLARPANPRLIVPGALAVLAGVVGLAVTLGLLPNSVLTFAAPLTPVVIGVVVVIGLLPLVFRRR